MDKKRFGRYFTSNAYELHNKFNCLNGRGLIILLATYKVLAISTSYYIYLI